LWAICLCACGERSDEAFPDEDRLLEGLMEEYVAARFAFYPAESTLAGLPGRDAALGSFSRSDIASRIQWLSDFHTKLMGLKLAALSQPAYLDALWLLSLTKAELFDLDERGLWTISAAFYGESIRIGLVSLLLAPDLANRTADLGGRLDAIPKLLEQAGENLAEVPDVHRRDGVRTLLLVNDLLSEMPVLLEEKVPAYRVAELSEKSRLAMRALQPLLSRLTEATPASLRPLGPEALRLYFLQHEMIDWPPDRILLAAREGISAVSSRMMEIALESLSDRDLEAILAENAPSPTPAEDVAASEARARGFLGADEGSGEIPDRAIPVRLIPPSFLAPDFLRLWRPASLDRIEEVSFLLSGAAPLSSKEIELSTLSEVAGGYRLFVRQSESASLLRRVFRARSSSEGMRSWLLRRVFDRGYGEADAELRLLQLHRELLESLRLEGAVSIHAFDASLAAVEERFRDVGHLSRERAAYEAERAAVDPGAGSAALGRLLLEELERDYLRSQLLSSPEEVEEAFLAEGQVPLRLLRLKLLGLHSRLPGTK
jgi:Bacterial protein of unknown function (DUF885)